MEDMERRGVAPVLILATLCRTFCMVVLLTFFATLAVGSTVAKSNAIPLQTVFAGASYLGAFEGDPRAAAVFDNNNSVIGYVFLTSDIVKAAGYSGKPITTAVGLDLKGFLTGAAIIEHHEPILILGIKEENLTTFIQSYKGLDIRQDVVLDGISGGRINGEGLQVIDGLTGASITSIVFNDSIFRAARMVARSRGIIEDVSQDKPRLDLDSFTAQDWAGLEKSGAIQNLTLSNRDVDDAYVRQYERAVPAPGGGEPEQTFMSLYATLVTPAGIGQNLLGFAGFSQLRASLSPGDQVLMVAGHGVYSFKGYTWRKRNGVFNRVQLIQGDKTWRFKKAQHQLVEKLDIKGSPDLREIALFVIPAADQFDALKPWRLDLIVDREVSSGENLRTFFALNYTLPAQFILQPEPATSGTGISDLIAEATTAGGGIWLRVWESRAWEIAALLTMLFVLYIVMVLHDFAARRPKLLRRFRVGFLITTLLGLGLIMNAQLSVVNVLTFIQSLLTEFHWDFFLLDPLVFILWSWVAIGLLFWGRGVFCGWLCPFGALQELASKLAKFFHVPQLAIPFGLSERVWPIKYIIFLGLLALSLHSIGLAEYGAEVEPFKTAIALKFVRAWPFVVYALGLLTAAMFVERVFCRYLCPLGAALAIPGKNRMFEWLRRRQQCGTECHICATRCPVQAIHPSGRIDAHECIYCLDCQMIYYDDHICPPMIARRKRREDRAERKQQRADARLADQTQI
ncbi:MAG: regulatory protein NosR [Alphaproteobacteria bacterium]|jgi:NosR/NirI family transcriptional regulator, nitrous oxide reductase regulator|nr:regulatory protein NosR [Alphaproteobacteria bacterium]